MSATGSAFVEICMQGSDRPPSIPHTDGVYTFVTSGMAWVFPTDRLPRSTSRRLTLSLALREAGKRFVSPRQFGRPPQSLNRLGEEMFQYHSMQLAGTAVVTCTLTGRSGHGPNRSASACRKARDSSADAARRTWRFCNVPANAAR